MVEEAIIQGVSATEQMKGMTLILTSQVEPTSFIIDDQVPLFQQKTEMIQGGIFEKDGEYFAYNPQQEITSGGTSGREATDTSTLLPITKEDIATDVISRIEYSGLEGIKSGELDAILEKGIVTEAQIDDAMYAYDYRQKDTPYEALEWESSVKGDSQARNENGLTYVNKNDWIRGGQDGDSYPPQAEILEVYGDVGFKLEGYRVVDETGYSYMRGETEPYKFASGIITDYEKAKELAHEIAGVEYEPPIQPRVTETQHDTHNQSQQQAAHRG